MLVHLPCLHWMQEHLPCLHRMQVHVGNAAPSQARVEAEARLRGGKGRAEVAATPSPPLQWQSSATSSSAENAEPRLC